MENKYPPPLMLNELVIDSTGFSENPEIIQARVWTKQPCMGNTDKRPVKQEPLPELPQYDGYDTTWMGEIRTKDFLKGALIVLGFVIVIKML